MIRTTTTTRTPAEKRWGYTFGERGVCPIDDAAKLLGCSRRTVERRVQEGYLRKGYAKPGAITSGVVICRRSIEDYLRSLEV